MSLQIFGKERNIPMVFGRDSTNLRRKRRWFSLSTGSDRTDKNT